MREGTDFFLKMFSAYSSHLLLKTRNYPTVLDGFAANTQSCILSTRTVSPVTPLVSYCPPSSIFQAVTPHQTEPGLCAKPFADAKSQPARGSRWHPGKSLCGTTRTPGKFCDGGKRVGQQNKRHVPREVRRGGLSAKRQDLQG